MSIYEYLSNIPVEPAQFIYGVAAILGGFARYFNSYIGGTPFQFRILMASMFVAGFSGYMFALLGNTLSLPAPMPVILAGTGGFFGDQTMKLIMEYSKSKL